MEIPLLQDIVYLFFGSIIVLYFCHLIRVPAIVGFLLTGLVIGPHGLGLVQSLKEVEILAEIGIVLLLFTIGIEFSFQKLLQVKKPVLIGGSLQVFITLFAIYALARQWGVDWDEAIFMGALIALSSTAIVLKILQENGQIDGPHGRTILAILIYQDLVIVPMIIFTPLLADWNNGSLNSVLWLLGEAFVIVTLIVLSAKYLVPRILFQIIRTKNRELFLITVVLICLSVAWLTSLAGLSLGLGAFLAGLVISESEYSHHALEGILPFKDVFNSFFFISVGMLLDLSYLFNNALTVSLLVALVLSLKFLIAGGITLGLGGSLRNAILVGLSLSQVGEFSFILSKTGKTYGLIGGDSYQMFLAVSVTTMALTPFIMKGAPRISDWVHRLPMPNRLRSGLHPVGKSDDEIAENLNDHLIIIGYGINGKNLSRAARTADIPYLIVELNPDTVIAERDNGEPIVYGDATNEAVLSHAGIQHARILVIVIADPAATARITQLARRLNPSLHIIVRTRFVHEISPLKKQGANVVVPEEFETSIEIFTLLLNKYLVPRDEIERFIQQIRSESYQMFRSPNYRPQSASELELHLSGVEIQTIRLSEGAHAIGKSPAELNLRKHYGVTLLAIRRNEQLIPNPESHAPLQKDDILIMMGTLDQINHFEQG